MLYNFHWRKMDDNRERRFAVAFFVSLAPNASPDFFRDAAVESKNDDIFGSLGQVRLRFEFQSSCEEQADRLLSLKVPTKCGPHRGIDEPLVGPGWCRSSQSQLLMRHFHPMPKAGWYLEEFNASQVRALSWYPLRTAA